MIREIIYLATGWVVRSCSNNSQEIYLLFNMSGGEFG